MWGGSEFQRVGAEKEKERRPRDDLMSGMTSSAELEDLRVRVGMRGLTRSQVDSDRCMEGQGHVELCR